ncbi:MAG TPA: serine hydrolase domain-containing protein [Neobacillus sp.]
MKVASKPTPQSEHPTKQKIRDYLALKHVNGSIAIVKEKQVIFNEGAGFSNRKNQLVNQSSTTFPIGSITKIFVATSILQLQEKGKLAIDDPVSKYFSKFPNGRGIKLIHLLTHTSGIKTPHLSKEDWKPKDIMKRMEPIPISFSAGKQWDYNDINYLVLGMIVEKVAGVSLHDYIQRNIFDKASMRHSGFIPSTPVAYSSIGYKRIAGQLIKSRQLNNPLLFGCADIYTTAYDLTQFDEALMSGKLVTKESLEKMLTPGSKSKYGLGLYILGNRVYSRGVLSGWESLHVYFKDKTSMAILLNVRDKKTNIHQLAEDLYKIINNQAIDLNGK